MTVESTLAFALAMLILAATPGPGVFASLAQALSSGFRSCNSLVPFLELNFTRKKIRRQR